MVAGLYIVNIISLCHLSFDSRYNKLFVLGPSNAERAVAVAESTNSTIKEFVETLVIVLVCGYVYKLI